MGVFLLFMLGNRAQTSGAPAAALIFVIAAFILIFILLLPSDQRDELLKSGSGGVSEGGGSGSFVVLKENPGTMTKLREREFEHRIPSFNIFIDREDSILKEERSFSIESDGVSERTIPFFVDGGATNGRLAFQVKNYRGVLKVEFNDEELFRGKVDLDSVMEPIVVPRIEEENVLKFSVDEPASWRFWERNFYDVGNVRVTGTVENTDRSEANKTFFMSKEEVDAENVESAFLSYIVDCRVREAGTVSVFLNDNRISSSVPECGNMERTFIDPSDFNEGTNELRFVAGEGRYLIDQVFVKTRLKKPVFSGLLFNLNGSLYGKISNGSVNATLSMNFVDDGEKKSAVIEVNGKKTYLDTRLKEYSKSVNSFLKEGSNYVRIEPERTFYVTELSVVVD